MRILVVTAAAAAGLVLVSSGVARPAHATIFPSAGIIVPGQSIGGIQIGMTQAQVKAAWGPNYTVCPSSACGSLLTWLYEYPGQDAALGAAVKFNAPAGTTSSSTTSGPSYAALEVTALADTKAAGLATAAATADAAKAASAGAAAAAAEAAEAKAAKSAGTSATKLAALKTAAKTAEAKAAAAKAASVKAAAAAKVAEAKAALAKTAAAKAKAASSGSGTTAPTTGGVVAVFTLGSPVGWGIKGQVMMGDPVSNVYNVFGSPATANCIGYSALTVRIGSSTTSFYSASGVIYGFALTAPSQSPCQ